MSAPCTRYALCHLCPGKWLRKDLIPKGKTVEEACKCHTEQQLMRHLKQEEEWSQQRLAEIRKQAKADERARIKKMKAKKKQAAERARAKGLSKKKRAMVMKKPAARLSRKK